MRHLAARGQLVSGGGGGAGCPVWLGATGLVGGSRGTHERGAERGPWSSKLQGRLKAWGGVWSRERGDLLCRAECPWHPGQSREAGGRLNNVCDGWRQGRQLPLPKRRGQNGGRYRAGCAIPEACRVVFRAVGAPCGRGNAAVNAWFEIAPFGAA